MNKSLAAIVAIVLILSYVPTILFWPSTAKKSMEMNSGLDLVPPNPDIYPNMPLKREVNYYGTRSTRASTTEEVVTLPIEFTDISHNSANDVSYFNALLFDEAPGARSLHGYYREVSYGQLLVYGTTGSRWYRSDYTMSYYGQDGGGVDDANGPIYMLVVEAVRKADADVDFSQYDKDGNGIVDHIIVVHAGEGQESSTNTNLIWSHRWAVIDADQSMIGDQRLLADGVQIYGYSMVSEYSPLGVFVHEFAHDLGLPDLYATSGTSDGVGVWDLMGSGSWAGTPKGSMPSHLSAWSKVKMGWINPIVVSSPIIGAEISQVETNPVVYKLPIRKVSGGEEYFLVENRQKVGFDSSLPGSGLLIWHIDESIKNNEDPSHRMVDLEEADEIDGENPTQGTDPWADNPEGFTPTSNPDSSAYGNVRTGWKVKDISPPAEVMIADLSKEVEDDLLVVKLDCKEITSLRENIQITATIANHGTSNQTNFWVNLTIYFEQYLPNGIVYSRERSISELRSEQMMNLTWSYLPEREGRYILEVSIDLPKDEIQENNNRMAHFTASTFFFQDYVEGGQNGWTPLHGTDTQYKWRIVGEGEAYGDYYSPTHSWRFGYFGSGIPFPPMEDYYILESPNINISGPSLFLIFYQRYDLSGRTDSGFFLLPRDTDHAYVLVSINNGSWTQVAHFRGVQKEWTRIYLDLNQYLGASPSTMKIRFSVTAKVMSQEGGWWIDDIFLFKNPLGYGVVVRPFEVEKSIDAGSSATYRLKLVNVGDFEDDFRFEIEGLPSEWVAYLSKNASLLQPLNSFKVHLLPDEESTIVLTILSHPYAARGSEVNATLTAISLGDGTQRSSFTATIKINDPWGLSTYGRYLFVGIILVAMIVAVTIIISTFKRQERGKA